MESDHEYFWSKNNGPNESQNHDRNRNADHQLAHLKDKSGIMKTYHVYTGENQYTNRYWEKFDRTEMSKDLKPFVMNSMNKRRNWEIEDLDSIELMRRIQEMHKGEDVMFLERVAMRMVDWPKTFRYDFFWDDFKVIALHELDSYLSGRPAYKKTSVNSGRGQHVNHFKSWNRTANKEDSERLENERNHNLEKEKRTVVVYHLIKSPHNYMDIFKKEFGRDNCNSARWAPPTYWERKRKQHSDVLDLRYDDFNDEGFRNEMRLDNDEMVEEEFVAPKFYNLEDHFVENFVVVKDRKNRRRKKN